jgi:hypothetical protein
MRQGPEIIACMTTVAKEVRRVSASIPIGVQILAGANQQALAVALAADLDFIRAGHFPISPFIISRRREVSKGVEDGRRPPVLRAGPP